MKPSDAQITLLRKALERHFDWQQDDDQWALLELGTELEDWTASDDDGVALRGRRVGGHTLTLRTGIPTDGILCTPPDVEGAGSDRAYEDSQRAALSSSRRPAC